jgi:hypothetical protein
MWSAARTAPVVAPGGGRCPLSKILLALSAGFAVAAVALGALIFGHREPGRVDALPIQPTSTAPFPTPALALPSHEVLARALVPTAEPAPAEPIPAPQPSPAVMSEASPPVGTAIPPLALSPQFDRLGDQWLLDNLRTLGYTITNPPFVIDNAHEACRLFQQGESPEQVNQQMSATTGMNMDDTLQLSSSAMLAYYPNCA